MHLTVQGAGVGGNHHFYSRQLNSNSIFDKSISLSPLTAWPGFLYYPLFFPVPTIKIVDERLQKVEDQIFYDGGSTIKLKCVVENIVGDQPEYIIWKKGNRMLNYDTERGGIRSVEFIAWLSVALFELCLLRKMKAF